MKWFVALLGAATLVACATIGSIQPLRFSSPQSRTSELRLQGPSPQRPIGGAALRLWARVENPNGFGLTLTQLVGDLFVSDAEAIAVDFPLGLPLVARQDTIIPLDISVGFDNLPQLGRIARAVVSGQTLPYRLDGSFAVAAGALGEPRFGPWTLLQGEVRVR